MQDFHLYTNITKQGCFIKLYFLETIILGTTKGVNYPLKPLYYNTATFSMY